MRCVVGLGSNLGERWQRLSEAVRTLTRRDHMTIVRVSPVYESQAVTRSPDDTQPPYLNAVAFLDTSISPEDVLAQLLEVEREAGRERHGRRRWAPRTLDLDLLAAGTETRDTPECTLPHPRLAQRRFVLRPWADLAPNQHVPAPFDATVAELLDCCPDGQELSRLPHTLSVPTHSA